MKQFLLAARRTLTLETYAALSVPILLTSLSFLTESDDLLARNICHQPGIPGPQ